MQPKRKHARPQNTNSVKQLSKISSTVHMLYHPSRVSLYLQYIHYTACRGLKGMEFVQLIDDLWRTPDDWNNELLQEALHL